MLYDTAIVPLLNSIALYDDEVDILLNAHREMCLEIEDVSFEEFIALGERIGSEYWFIRGNNYNSIGDKILHTKP